MLWLWIGGAVVVLLLVRFVLRARGTAGRDSQGDLDRKIRDAQSRGEGRGADWL